MELKDKATRVAVLTALRDAIDDVITEERAGVSSNLIELSQALGVKSLDVFLPNGEAVGTVSLSSSEPKAYVDNEGAFLRWVKENAPQEIMDVVRDTYKKVLLERVANMGDVVIDTKTGQIVEGVAFRDSAPRMTLRFKKDGRAEVAKAYNSGELEQVIRPLVGNPIREIVAEVGK